MKRGNFKKPSLDKVRAKQAAKRSKLPQVKSKPKRKAKTLAWYKKELDRIFSVYIRNRDQGQCFTCSKKDDPKKMQNGHFVPRQYLAVRYDEMNCNCQCYACNMLYNGQGATYAVRLAQKYGQDKVDWLESQRWVTFKVDQAWYEEKIAYYKNKISVDYSAKVDPSRVY